MSEEDERIAEFEGTVNGNIWLFREESELLALRGRANVLGRERVIGRGDALERARCMVVWSEEEWESQAPGLFEESIEISKVLLNVQEETQLKRWYERQIFALCSRRSPVQRLRRSAKVSCTAVILFKRFYLSNSIMEIDPVLTSLSALFSASKLEDEFADAAELARAHSGDEAKAEALTTAIREFEVDLLQGCNFDLRIAHPDRFFIALAEASDDLEATQDAADALYLTDAPLLARPEILALAALLYTRSSKQLPPAASLMTDEMKAQAIELASLHELDSLFYHIRATPDDDKVKQANALVKPLHKRLKKVALWRSSSSVGNHSAHTPSDQHSAAPSSDPAATDRDQHQHKSTKKRPRGL